MVTRTYRLINYIKVKKMAIRFCSVQDSNSCIMRCLVIKTASSRKNIMYYISIGTKKIIMCGKIIFISAFFTEKKCTACTKVIMLTRPSKVDPLEPLQCAIDGFRINGRQTFFNIRLTYLSNVDSLTPHFYMIKLWFTGVYILSYFGYSLEPRRQK